MALSEGQKTKKEKWYQKTGWIIVLLILFFPAGLILMWQYTNWNKTAKLIVAGFFLLLVVANMFSGNNSNLSTSNSTSSDTNSSNSDSENAQSANAEEAQIDKAGTESTPIPTSKPQVKVTTTPAPTQVKQADTKNTSPVSNETVSQKNAVRQAKSYLNYSAFSHDGLVVQLEYEQFPHDDAVYGADNSGANWNEQAARMAKSYMEYSAFSRGSLIDQLKYEKFTQEQAEYGANSVGL